MATEYEVKFRATPQLLTEIDRAFSEVGQGFSMETTYYDTPSGALSARHYTLRARLENGVRICTLKTPAQIGRGEWEIRCDTIEDAVVQFPALGCPEDFAQLVQEGIIPICGARFHRIAKSIPLAEGTVELALDAGILMGGGQEIPLCEVEVELKSGSVQLCDTFAKMLASRFGLQPEPHSKFRRALALYKGENNA